MPPLPPSVLPDQQSRPYYILNGQVSAVGKVQTFRYEQDPSFQSKNDNLAYCKAFDGSMSCEFSIDPSLCTHCNDPILTALAICLYYSPFTKPQVVYEENGYKQPWCVH